MSADMSNIKTDLPSYGRIDVELLGDPATSDRAKVVFAILDYNAGFRFLSIQNISDMLGCSPASTRRALSELREAGWVEITKRSKGDQQLENDYRVRSSATRGGTTTGDRGVPPPATGGTSTGDRGTYIYNKPQEETQEPTPPAPEPAELDLGISRTKKPKADPMDGFEEFWGIYPSGPNGTKKQARDRWRAARKIASLEEILAGAARYRDSPKRKADPYYTKGAGAWLRDHGWTAPDPANLPAPARDPRYETVEERLARAAEVKARLVEKYGDSPMQVEESPAYWNTQTIDGSVS